MCYVLLCIMCYASSKHISRHALLANELSVKLPQTVHTAHRVHRPPPQTATFPLREHIKAFQSFTGDHKGPYALIEGGNFLLFCIISV